MGTSTMGGGTSVSLYNTRDKGVELVKGSPFTFSPKTSWNGGPPFSPTTTLVDPDNNFAYVVYENTSLPILVKFAIKPTGLVFVWQSTVSNAGAPELAGSECGGACITIVGDYIIEKTYPYGLWVNILNSSGQSIVVEGYGQSPVNASHITGKYYYSCRIPSQGLDVDVNGTATTVAVYDLTRISYTGSNPETAIPFVTSNDPAYVQSECGLQR
jgi:hypothetical protein